MANPSQDPSSFDALARVRGQRLRPTRETRIAAEMDRQMRELKSRQRAVGGCAAAWEMVVPSELAGAAVLEGVYRGVLIVRVGDASARFALDRFLRAGGERAFIQTCSTPVRRIKLLG